MMATIVWFTGLPASGKSTLAELVRAELGQHSRSAIVLDSDELRDILGNQDYTPCGRDRFYEALGDLAIMLARQGHLVLVAATAPRRVHRDRVRAQVPGFVEVWVRTPLDVCQARDPKGLYARARAGDAPDLPGLGGDYEPPTMAEVVVDDVTASGAAAVVSRIRDPG
jgi:adenylylsulfate kinase